MICGLAAPSEGTIRLFGADPKRDHNLYQRISVMSEHDSAYEFMTGVEFVTLTAQLKRQTPAQPTLHMR